jgi:hypothetical protein
MGGVVVACLFAAILACAAAGALVWGFRLEARENGSWRRQQHVG